MKKNPLVSPILKWVGGKRQLLDEILPLVPKYTTYVEPFVGGGALFFELQPSKALINDFNNELINVYQTIKDNPELLIESLLQHKEKNTHDYFYELRELDRNPEVYGKLSNVDKASRVIYLNKTCYNGLYRVNASGQFNSPYGKYKNPNIVNDIVIRAISDYLKKNKITILNGDYKYALENLGKGTFVYLDPPYMPISSSASFTGYTENGFDENMQTELKNECDKLNSKGIKFLQSNSDCKFIRDLYKGYNIKTIKAKRSINSKGDKRGDINELLIFNYDFK